jgi:protein TonB
MFQETLLESSPISPQRRGWPMATAFTFQMLVASAFVVLPLLSTGIISINSPTMPVPLTYDRPPADTPHQRPAAPPAGARPVAWHEVVPLANGHPLITIGYRPPTDSTSSSDAKPCLDSRCVAGPDTSGPPNLFPNGPAIVPKRPDGPVRKSHMDPGMLVNRVEPVYPPIAVRTGVQGEVKLHAIIARDGTIQSLSVISGHPLLTAAAVAAVQQWRYRPYVLNGEKVEVDTYITVNFHRD